MAAEKVPCYPQGEASPFIPAVSRPEPFTLVILGVTGDLAARKILPALYGLWRGGYFPPDFALVGVGRRDKDDEAFRADVRQALATFGQGQPVVARGPRKAVRPRPRQRQRAGPAPRALSERRAALPHRPLPRQGHGTEHPGVPLWQRDLRAPVQPPVRGARADHRGGDR